MIRQTARCSSAFALVLLAPLLSGCTGFAMGFVSDSRTTRAAGVEVSVPPASARPALAGPVLGADGACEPATRPSEIATGIGECELVSFKGRAPDDVLVGQGRGGERETQVMYSEPGGRELYFFSDNRLTRTFRPGQG